MIIKLSPQRMEGTLEVVKTGDVLTINGKNVDLSPLPDGATLPASAIDSEWFVGDVSREAGELVVALLLPLPSNYSQEQAFPADLIDVPDGPVQFPQPLPTQNAEGLQ